MPPDQDTLADAAETVTVESGSDPSVADAIAAAETASRDASADAGAESTTGAGREAGETQPGQQPSEAAARKLPSATNPQQPTKSTKPGASHGGRRSPAAAAVSAKPGEPAAPDPVKLLNDERAAWGRERQQAQQQLEQIRTQVQRFEQQEAQRRAEAERQALKAWHPRHPDYQSTRERLGRVNAFNRAVAALPAEMQKDAALVQNMAREMQVSPDDAKLSREFDINRENTLREFSESPDGFISRIIESEVPALIQQAFNQFQVFTKAQAEVQRDWSDPEKLAPHAEWVRERLAAKVPYEAVREGVEMRNRIAELEAQLKSSSGAVAQADAKAQAAAERQRLAKGNATITRDTKTTGKPDVYRQTLDWAKANSVKVGSTKFNAHLRDLEEAQRQHE